MDCTPAEQIAQCGGGATINATPDLEAVCQCAGPTGVEDSSWGSVKILFD